jgi:DNA-binding beta-propeller fold protein YncE
MLTKLRIISITLTSMLAIHVCSAAGPTTQAIALLRWYSANQTTHIAVGATPYGVAFDGSNIWVANSYSNAVTKLRASDNAVLGNFGTGSYPFFLAYDGANMWVSNSGDNTVSKLRASDGKALGTFPVGINPHGLVFDGVNIWVANYGSQNVTKLRASDGTNQGTFARTLRHTARLAHSTPPEGPPPRTETAMRSPRRVVNPCLFSSSAPLCPPMRPRE